MIGNMSEETLALKNWFNNTREYTEEHGLRGARVGVEELLVKGGHRFVGKNIWNYGTPVFDLDWDVLVILDACRHDLFSKATTEYEWLPDSASVFTSLGSHTSEWMEKNFTSQYSQEMQDCIYISGNPQSGIRLDSNDWYLLSEPWRNHRNEIGTIDPRVLTDFAVKTAREHPDKRLVVHYMQPHQPFREFNHIESGDHWISKDVWTGLHLQEFSPEDVWNAYYDNLLWVLDEVKTLVHNMDGEVTLSSDHGNAFGERGIYGHPQYVPIKCLKEVPLVRLSATDTGTHTPTFLPEKDRARSEADIDERLSDLGYV